MSVTENSNGNIVSINRLQPIDPVAIIDWRVDLAGAAGGGFAQINLLIPANRAFVPVFLSINNSLDTALEVHWELNAGSAAGPGDLFIQENLSAPLVNGQVSFNVDLKKIARAMFVPDIGSSPRFSIVDDNPGDGETLRAVARCYLWPRSDVVGLPPRIFFPYLT